MIHQLIGYWHSDKNIRLILGFSLMLLVCLSINDVFAATGKPCTLCHPLLTPETEAQVTEWNSSGHAKSLETLKASPDAEDACLRCHTADYVFDENITLDNATLNNDCAVCHEDHIGLGITADVEPTLLKPKNELCNDCHSASSGIPGEKPRSAQVEIFTGTGGIGVADSPSLHGEIMEDGCVTCHAPSVETETGKRTVHTFKTPGAAFCTDECHLDDQEMITEAKEEIETKLAEVTKLLEEFPDKESKEYKDAKFNVDLVSISGDFGAHNFRYSQSLLDYSKSILQGGQQIPAWDVNQDGAVDISDLIIIGNHFGEEIKDSPTPNPDVNGDGIVNISDLVIVGIHFGE